MQRLGRSAVSLLQFNLRSASGAAQQLLQPAPCAEVEGLRSFRASQAGCTCWQQVHTVHGSGAEPSHQEGPSSTSSSSSRAMPWRQLHQGLTQGSHQAAWLGESASGSSSSTSRRPYITSFSPLQQPALADSPSAAESAADAALEAADNEQRGMQLNPAAAPKQIEGVCRRRNIKCGWKKIDFVLRMIRRATVDDAMAQLKANPKRSAVFVQHAVANARNNAIVAGGDPAKLYVHEAFVTKGVYEKRTHFMSRGFASLKETQKSHLNVHVRQMDDEAAAAVLLRRKPKLVAPLMHRMQERQRKPRWLATKGWEGSKGSRQQVA